jgi:hypothetical protein
METIIKIKHETIVKQLADAIAAFNISKVEELLSEKGEYCIQDDKDEIIIGNKTEFIAWLGNSMNEFITANEDRTELNYTLDQCLHCKIGNPVIIFENGRFPVFTREFYEREKCGLMLEFDDNLVCGITFCFVFLKTENPYLYEKRKCLRN